VIDLAVKPFATGLFTRPRPRGDLDGDVRQERSSVLSRYFSEIREYPLLTKDEEMALADA